MRVTVAEDSGLYRDLLTRTLTAAGHRVSTAGSATELLTVVDATRPDMLLTDIRMPPTYTDDGLRAALRVRERYPRTGVVLLSNHGEVSYALQLVNTLRERAGYLLKERATGDRELLETLDRVAAGGLVIDPDVVALLVSRPRNDDNPLRALTARELDTLKLMAEGLGNTAIARRLRVTTSTVEKHATALFRKLGLGAPAADENARVSAVLTYLRHSGQLPRP
ncbi:MAG: response regulator transcription factor [Actinobacteria bacterium]|nr:MAG: response regulator transcription factor [Actinomycetota bacterium]